MKRVPGGRGGGGVHELEEDLYKQSTRERL